MGATIRKDVTPQIDADGIAEAQTLGGAGNFSLDGALVSGGVFTVTDSAHLIDIPSVGDDSLLTFTITGKDSRNVAITEDVAGTNAGTATSTKYFKTVTQVASDGATAGNVTIGVAGICVSAWILMNRGKIINVGMQIDLSSGASLTWAVENTQDDLQENSDVIFAVQDHPVLTAQTTSNTSNYAYGVSGYRLKTTAFTSGTIAFNSVQAY